MLTIASRENVTSLPVLLLGVQLIKSGENTLQHKARVAVYVQPRASKTEVVGRHGDSIKIRLAAPPVDGAANTELETYISKLLKVPKSSVQVVMGASSRRKVVEITTNQSIDVERALLEA